MLYQHGKYLPDLLSAVQRLTMLPGSEGRGLDFTVLGVCLSDESKVNLSDWSHGFSHRPPESVCIVCLQSAFDVD